MKCRPLRIPLTQKGWDLFMRICFFRTRRTRKLLIIPKRYLAIPAALVCIFALCLLVNLPASVATASADRQLPIYCVEKDSKVCSLSFDAAWGTAILRRKRINGLCDGVWEEPDLSYSYAEITGSR